MKSGDKPKSAKARRAWMGSLVACLIMGIGASRSGVAQTSVLTRPGAGASAAQDRTLADASCHAIATRVDDMPGGMPVLLRSYDSRRGQGAAEEPSLRSAAFTYDNAVAVIALLSCGRLAQARRVGEALRLATMHDERLRDVYRAGVVKDGAPLANGWWDARQKRWIEAAQRYAGAYQDGTSSGNVAWVALAFLDLYDTSGEARWREAAVRLANWVVVHASDPRGAGGFNGGIESFRLVPRQALWKSTEHNIDLVALFEWLDRIAAPGGDWHAQARRARAFVAAQWDAPSGHFWMGTTADGVTPVCAPSVLDVQLWAQLLPDAPDAWRRALDWAEHIHAVRDGFDFNDDRDGAWTEGTAQAALVYRWLGHEARAQGLLVSLARQTSPGGFLYATPATRITAVYSWYRHQPCLAATAWAVLAARKHNPYTPNHGANVTSHG